MSPKLQRILFLALVGVCLLMALILLHLRERAHQRLLGGQSEIPAAIEGTADQSVDLVLASDLDGSLTPQKRELSLPSDPGTRARIILNVLLAGYADPRSNHHLPVGDGGVQQVFLMPVQGAQGDHPPLLAVVNLKKEFVEAHPSGLETETLTILSLLATLHSANDRIAQVSFLVDGQQHDTLAGHIDLKRTYLTSETGAQP